MSTSGSGLFGNVGGPQIPLQRDLEATAWTEINKASLLIVKPDTYEVIPFTQGEGANQGKYVSKESRPLLDMPLFSAREATSADIKESLLSKTIFEALLKGLGQKMAHWMQTQLLLPKEERDLDFFSVNASLEGLSAFLAKLTSKKGLDEIETPLTKERRTPYQKLAETCLDNLRQSLSEISPKAEKLLEFTGASTPHFDALIQEKKHLDSTLNDFYLLSQSLTLQEG